MGPQKGTKWHTLAILRHPQTQCADRCVIKQFINAKTKEKPNSHHACVTYLVPIKCVGTTYQIKHHWYIILDTECWYSSPIGGLYIYMGQTASTLTSRLQRTGNSPRTAALAFALLTRSVRKHNRVKGTLLCTLRRAHRRCTGPCAPTSGDSGFDD